MKQPFEYFIGCDPSTKHVAFAIYKNKTFQEFLKIPADFNEISKFFFDFRHKNYTLAIETQYLYLNIATLIKLVEVRTLITTLANVNNCKKIITVTPQQWQSMILGTNQKQKREQRKKVSLLVASKITKQNLTDNDIADAVCIANFLITMEFAYGNKICNF
ncbi:MAG: crossover junction endodeoxyribonuclease RuvC [Desulfurella sp.]